MLAVLTYDKLFDYLREERNSVQLQKLPSSYYSDVINYLKNKEGSIDSLRSSGSLTVDNSVIQLNNAKKIIQNIYERREKKILLLALNKSRTQSSLIDTSGLLPEEKIFFKQICVLLDHFRGEILNKILNKDLPNVDNEKDAIEPEIHESVSESEASSNDSLDSEASSLVSIKFSQYVDKFVGSDLDILGPFNEGDIERLPSEVADVMISKGFAEKIEISED